MKHTVSYRLTAVLAAFVLAALFSCRPQVKKEEPVFAVNVTPVTRGSISDYILVNGDVETLTNIDVFADKSGEILSINVSLGQYVAAGQTIARVDPSRPGQRFIPNPVTAPIAGTIVALPVQLGATVNDLVTAAALAAHDAQATERLG